MHLAKLFQISLLGLTPLLSAVYAQSQAAPALNLTTYTRLSPDTKAGLGTGVASNGTYNNNLFLAEKGMGNDYLWIGVSANGVNFSIQEDYDSTYNAPSVVWWNNGGAEAYLYWFAFTDQDGAVWLWKGDSATDIREVTELYNPSASGGLPATSSPTLVVHNGGLYVYWETDSPSGNFISSVGYGAGAVPCTTSSSPSLNPTSHSAVGAVDFNGTLYVAFQNGSSSTSNTLMVCNNSTNTYTQYSGIHPESGISAAVFNGNLYFGYKSNSSANYLEITGTHDGTTFTTPGTVYTGLRINGQAGYEIAPSLVDFTGQLWVFYTANDNTHYVYSAHSY